MLFNSLEFALFLPVVFAVYWMLSRRLTLQNLWIIVASYFFYAVWDWRYLSLIVFTTLSTYLSGILIARWRESSRPKAVAALWCNIGINLCILAIFKYFNFFADNFAQLLNMVGMQADTVTLEFALPVGISFYTIQAIGYSIDVYRGAVAGCRNPLAFFAFLSFFPQLVAGPIERATNLLPQFERPRRRFDYAAGVDGCRRILWGLFKKVVIADTCATTVDSIFTFHSNYGTITLIIGAILFAFQIYGDFSGYSDIAIGAGRLFGINLMENFRQPFLSRSFKELWRRWHISLNGWFTHYLYFPLGGSRGTTVRTCVNIMFVFLLCGLWHGASWNYVIWGAYCGLMLLIERFTGLGSQFDPNTPVRSRRGLPVAREAFAIVITFAIFVVGTTIFRNPDIHDTISYINRMFTGWRQIQPIVGYQASCLCLLLMAIEWIQRKRRHTFDIDNIKSPFLRYTIYWILLVTIHFYSITKIDFIYFQF